MHYIFPICEKPYVGKIYENGFKIIRQSIIRNSFRPIIIGNIIKNNDETFLELLLRPYLIILIIMSIFLFPFLIFPLIGLFDLFIRTKDIITIVLTFIIILLFAIISVGIFYSIMVIFFKIETKKSKTFICNLFEIDFLEEEKNIIEIIKYMKKSANLA
jgi:hypothetical protein